MSDIVERLEGFTESDAYGTPWTFGLVVKEAAAELTRLRAAIAKATGEAE